MKSLLAILRITIFVVLSALAFVGWRAFSIWSAGSTPATSEARWSVGEALVGESITLEADVRLPYHQTPVETPPSRVPEALVVRRDGVAWIPGPLGFDGFRNWSLRLDAVLLSDESASGQSLAFPLDSWGKGRDSRVTVTLPTLTAAYSTDMPDSPALRTTALKVDPPAPETLVSTAPETGTPWWIAAAIAGGVVILVLAIIFLRRARKPAPPWVTANAELERLSSANDDLPTLYTRLGDILKAYTGSRFECPATASCPHEFRRLLDQVEHPSLSDEIRGQLYELLCETDSVRFAHHSTSRDRFVAALAPVREFVKATTPKSSNEPA